MTEALPKVGPQLKKVLEQLEKDRTAVADVVGVKNWRDFGVQVVEYLQCLEHLTTHVVSVTANNVEQFQALTRWTQHWQVVHQKIDDAGLEIVTHIIHAAWRDLQIVPDTPLKLITPALTSIVPPSPQAIISPAPNLKRFKAEAQNNADYSSKHDEACLLAPVISAFWKDCPTDVGKFLRASQHLVLRMFLYSAFLEPVPLKAVFETYLSYEPSVREQAKARLVLDLSKRLTLQSSVAYQLMLQDQLYHQILHTGHHSQQSHFTNHSSPQQSYGPHTQLADDAIEDIRKNVQQIISFPLSVQFASKRSFGKTLREKLATSTWERLSSVIAHSAAKSLSCLEVLLLVPLLRNNGCFDSCMCSSGKKPPTNKALDSQSNKILNVRSEQTLNSAILAWVLEHTDQISLWQAHPWLLTELSIVYPEFREPYLQSLITQSNKIPPMNIFVNQKNNQNNNNQNNNNQNNNNNEKKNNQNNQKELLHYKSDQNNRFSSENRLDYLFFGNLATRGWIVSAIQEKKLPLTVAERYRRFLGLKQF